MLNYDPQCQIDDMDELIDHIMSIQIAIDKAKDLSDPALISEYRLFKEYIKWRSRELNLQSLEIFGQIPELPLR